MISQNPSSSSRDAYSSIFEFFYRNQVPYPVIPGIPPFDVTTNQSEESLTRSPPAILPIRPLPARHRGVRIFPIQAICSPFLALVINLSLLQTLTFWFFWLHCTGHTKLTLDSKWYEKNVGKGMFAVQFSSGTQSCPTLCHPMNHSMTGLPVHHQVPESTQTHVHRVGDAIQPSHPLLSPSPPAFNLSQHQGVFK